MFVSPLKMPLAIPLPGAENGKEHVERDIGRRIYAGLFPRQFLSMRTHVPKV